MFLVRLLIGVLVSISVAFGNPDAVLNIEEVYVSGDTIPQSSVAQVVVSAITKTGFGATITGVDVENLSDAEFDIINRTLLEYRVLVIRNQHDLSIDGQRNFTRRFGELQVHLESASHLPGYADVNVVSNIKNEDGAFTGLYGKHVENFHADLSWYVNPFHIFISTPVDQLSRSLNGALLTN